MIRLAEGVDSLLAQTIPDWELVFWDNRSTDRSAETIKGYQDSRIRYFLSTEHTTLGVARKKAVEKAQGTWVGVLDTDDLWLPNKLERQLAPAKAMPSAGLIYGRCEIFRVDEVDRKMNVQPPLREKIREGDVFKQLARENFMSLVSIMYRREFMEDVGGFRKFEYAADYDLSLRLSLRHPVAAVDEIICQYRWHKENASHHLFEVGVAEVEEVLSGLSGEDGAASALKCWRANHAVSYLMQGRIGLALKKLFGTDKLEFARLICRGVGRRFGIDKQA